MMRSYKLPDGTDFNVLNPDEARFFYEQIFLAHAYTQHGIKLEDDAIVFDVGANIGMFALYVHQHVKNPRLFAFEPVTEVFQVLLANMAKHAINAQLFPCAPGASNGEATFTLYVHEDVITQRPPEAPPSEGRAVQMRSYRVPVRPLSEIIAEAKVDRIDLLKIDLARAELEVIRGVGDANWSKIRQVVVELDDTDGRLAALRSLFGVLGFQVEANQDPTYAKLWTLFARRA